jgi:hypothetical protein
VIVATMRVLRCVLRKGSLREDVYGKWPPQAA